MRKSVLQTLPVPFATIPQARIDRRYSVLQLPYDPPLSPPKLTQPPHDLRLSQRSTQFGMSFRCQSAKPLFRPMYHHPEIAPRYAELAAHAVFIPFIQKDGFQDVAILGSELRNQGTHVFLVLLCNQFALQVRSRIPGLWSVFIELRHAVLVPEMLHQHVVADRVDVSAQALRLPDAFSPADASQHA